MGLAVGKVERELGTLRKETAAANDPGQLFPDIRAAVGTLVIWARDADEAEEAGRDAAYVSSHHPTRSVIVVPGPVPVEADVSVQCTIAGEHQVCFEQIVLRGGTEAEAASAAEQLLLADVPVILWTVSGPFPGAADRLLGAADRLVLDSHERGDPFEVLHQLAYVDRSLPGVWVSDLDWVRLTPWRRVMAQFFDCARLVPHLDRLVGVRVRHLGPSLRPYLLAGWVLDRLGLRPGEVGVEVVEAPGEVEPGHLAGFELVTADGRYQCRSSGDSIEVATTVPDAPVPQPARVQAVDRATVLADELAQTHVDRAFTGALHLALEIKRET